MGIDAEMFVRTTTKVTDEKLREWHYKLGCAFHDHLWAFRTHENKVPEELYLFKVKIWEQDGPSIIPRSGEMFLRLRPTTRYYGPGYERGNIIVLMAIAEFLEQMIPDSEVWYGGDSSGALAAPFGPRERAEMMRYFVANQPSPYFASPGRAVAMGSSPTGTPVCPYCNVETSQFGFGSDYASFMCLGCHWKSVRRGDKISEGWKMENAL